MSYRILVINPGSTSTKIGVYEDEQLLFDKTLRHSAEDIAQFKTIAAQKDWRRDLVMRALREQGIDARTCPPSAAAAVCCVPSAAAPTPSTTTWSRTAPSAFRVSTPPTWAA